MKVLIIGSTTYRDQMVKYYEHRIVKRDVRIAVFDDFKGSEYEMCSLNREYIEWADEVHVLWDGRSIGTIFDLGMCFALRKKIHLLYLENKSFINFIKQYDQKSFEDKI